MPAPPSHLLQIFVDELDDHPRGGRACSWQGKGYQRRRGAPVEAGARAAATFADRIAPAARTLPTTRRLDHMGTRSLNAATGVGGLFVSFALVAGCGTTSDPGMIVFSKAGASTADRQKDENACLRTSIGTDDQTRILVPFQVDRAAYQKCMEALGYTASPAK